MKIQDDFAKMDVLKKEGIPEELALIEVEIYELENQLFDIVEVIERIEVDETISILDELTDLGKPRYSNEERRKVELSLRLRTNKEYQEMRQKRKQILSERDYLRIRRDYWKNSIKLLFNKEI